MHEQNRELVLRFLSQPSDVNFGGNVHGGAVMKWIDQAGYACATAWSGNYCVTVYVGEINFYAPIKIGNLVEVYAKIVYTGRTSMHIVVDLRACNPRKCVFTKAIHCIIVFVSVDESGNPIKVPAWHPITEKDIALGKYVTKLTELRKLAQNELDYSILEQKYNSP